jgi:bifunctional non-homologous end joining protein LigD
MARGVARRRTDSAALPAWVAPRLTQLVDAAPEGDQWLHEIKYDGYRMHARLDRGSVKLLTRTGLDWTHKYPAIAKAVAALDARQAYLDGELCGVDPDGVTAFNIVQLASDSGNASALVYFLFDLLHLDDEDISARPPIERKARVAALLSDVSSPLHYSDHQIGHAHAFHLASSTCRKWQRTRARAQRSFTIARRNGSDGARWRGSSCDSLYAETAVDRGDREWL